jgi:two-component system sensor histidine kinase TctE
MTRLSLRGRLFILIILPLFLVAALAATARFVLAERTSRKLYDDALLVVALTISRDVVLSEGDMLAELLLERLTTVLGDPVYYRISGPEGRFVTGYSNPPDIPNGVDITSGLPVFFDATSLDRTVRAVVLREFISEPQFGGWVTVEVWQTVRQREALSFQLLRQSLLMMAVVIAAAALLVWFGINIGLRPLTDLRTAIARRSPDDLGPIRRTVPREVRALVGAMNALFARLSDSFASRDALISDAAHQLRNPIAALQAQAEAALTAPTEEDLRTRVEGLADIARRTSRLTRQLLSMEKARGRAKGDHCVSTDVVELARRVTRRFAEKGLQCNTEVGLHAGPGAIAPVVCDAVAVEEALKNLLDNAFKYGCPEGGVIAVCVEQSDEFVWFRVTDSGPGIPAATANRVFDRFFRLQDDDSGGCGLGLAIVREVAESHLGRVEVGRDQDFSSFAFCVRLPEGRTSTSGSGVAERKELS